MALREEFEQAGHWLFRWRSYLPLVMIGPLLLGIKDLESPGHSEVVDHLWDMICMVIAFFGLGIRVFTVGYAPAGTSGRNTREQVAELLNTTGMYSIVRHPLYLGNFFIWLGVSLFTQSVWFTLLFVLIFWGYYEMIMFAEEAFLRKKFGVTYLNWAEKTPAFFPKPDNWRPPRLPFSFRTVLKREYSGFFGIVVSFSLLDIVSDRWSEGKWDFLWFILLVVGLTIYLAPMTLKKKTKILDVEGR